MGNALDPIATLRQAHDIAVEKLGLLSTVARGLDEGSNPTALETLREVLQFFDSELGAHFRHEEVALFPALEKVIGREGPIMVMLDEHQSFWRAVDALKDKVVQLERASADDRPKRVQEVAGVVNHIVGLLDSHINKENNMLFPIAEESLSTSTMLEIAEQMKGMEQAA